MTKMSLGRKEKAFTEYLMAQDQRKQDNKSDQQQSQAYKAETSEREREREEGMFVGETFLVKLLCGLRYGASMLRAKR